MCSQETASLYCLVRREGDAGHSGEISKVNFNSQGSKIITASSDKTCRIWNAESGTEL